MNSEHISLRFEMEENEKWRELSDKIPFLNFPSSWRIKIIPPFGGAICRFIVECGNNSTSIYLDFYDRLGYFGSPYWEVYPYEGDTFRCDINDTESLIGAVDRSLKRG